MKIVLLAGKARSGKDTFAGCLKEEYEKKGNKVCILQNSTYLKFYAQKYFGWDGREETKPRDLLIELGTDIIRKQIDPHFLINRLIQDIKVLSHYFDVFIVSDVREEIELTIPKNNFDNVVSIKIVRPSFESELDSNQKKTYTEIALDNYSDYDYTITNDSTLDDLKSKAKNFVLGDEKNE